jgi:hypothetical protein
LRWKLVGGGSVNIAVILLNERLCPMDDRNGFVADGYDRARDANQPIFRSEVEREFAARLSNASAAHQKRIRAEMEREIEKRLNALAPPDALY